MIYLLTVIFFNLNGEPYSRDGWYPFEVPTIERCEIGKTKIEKYLNAMGISGYEVHCVQKK